MGVSCGGAPPAGTVVVIATDAIANAMSGRSIILTYPYSDDFFHEKETSPH
jgi:hypothetical protein